MNTSADLALHKNSKSQKMKEQKTECQYTSDPISLESRFQQFSSPTDGSLLQPVVPMGQHEAVWALGNMTSRENVTCSQSLEKLFLDLESVRLSKEDEDSASDLSDSERVPIPPSPLTPPKLNLRAEEIKPGDLSQCVENPCKEYEYPDVLPPPYNSWNLPQVSMFVHKGKSALQSTASAPLERYVDRLLQLEWLQMQTVQSEKTKAGKSRPQTVPASCRNGKSPGKCKPWPSKYTSHSDNVTKTSAGPDKNCHKKSTHRESCAAACLRKSFSGSVEIPQCSLKQTQDVRCKKKSVTNYQQTKDVLVSDSKMQCAGNIRPQRQMFVSSSAESIATKTKATKIRKSDNSHATNRRCISERKK